MKIILLVEFLVIISSVVGEMVTFKPFVRSRYSLRKRQEIYRVSKEQRGHLATESPELKPLTQLSIHSTTTIPRSEHRAHVDASTANSPSKSSHDLEKNKTVKEAITGGTTIPAISATTPFTFITQHQKTQSDWSYDYYGGAGIEDDN